MKLHDLKPAEGATTARKRLGRGVGSGLGKTSSGGKRPGFEGGQMPLTMRLPKRGFTNKWRVEYATVNVDRLNIFEDGAVVSPVELIQAGILKNVQDGVKILGNGEITKKLTVQANKFTASAKEKIEAAGGKVEVF